jgi:hypothetical protein
MSVKVFNVKTRKWDDFAQYIGRVNRTWGFEQSPFHNPFPLRYEHERLDILITFAAYWYAPEQKNLRDAACREIRDAVLCWCAPKMCHGDIIGGYLDAVRAGCFGERVED